MYMHQSEANVIKMIFIMHVNPFLSLVTIQLHGDNETNYYQESIKRRREDMRSHDYHMT